MYLMVKLSKIFSDLHDGLSVRQIHRNRHVSRQTVQKFKDIYDKAVVDYGSEDAALIELLHTQFAYKKCEREKTALVKVTTDRIDSLLEENAVLKRTAGMRKLVKNKKTIYSILCYEGYNVSYSSVCTYIRNKDKSNEEPTSEEAFPRLHHLAGEEVEFDWGEFSLLIGGSLIHFQMAVFTFCHSNYRIAYLYKNQNTLSFYDAHVRFFREVGGIPKIMIYDNMRIVVKAFNGRQKELTDCLINLEAFYRFKSRLCNSHAGNEKGQVERSVDVVRQQVFAKRYKYDSFEEACNWLQEQLIVLNQTPLSSSTKNIVELSKEDLAAIRSVNPHKSDMPCFEIDRYSVDKYSTINFLGNHYSVPDFLVNKEVDVKIYANEIEIKYQGKQQTKWYIAQGKDNWMIKIDHYLNTLLRKPGAVHQSEALCQAPEVIRNIYNIGFNDTPKQFIELLLYAKEHEISYERLSEIQLSLISSGISKPKYEHFMAYLNPIDKPKDSMVQEGADTIEEQSLQTLEDLTTLMNEGQKNEHTTA